MKIEHTFTPRKEPEIKSKKWIVENVPIEQVAKIVSDLKPCGNSLRGLSPFTDIKTPCFWVMPEKKIFKCFKTQKIGNVIRLIMEVMNVDEEQAIIWLSRFKVEPTDVVEA